MMRSFFQKPVTLRRVLRWLAGLLGLFLLWFLLSITVPYAFTHPPVSAEYMQSVAETDFYDTTPGTDRVRLITSNQEALEERVRLISQAQERIIYASFDFRTDNSGQDVLALLLNAAQRGVQVQLLIDGLMTYTQLGNTPLFQALAAQPNVEVRRYNPPSLLQPEDFHGRMHDKYVIIDEDYYLLGGRNTYDYFIGSYPTEHPSLDLELLVWNTSGDETQSSMTQLLDYFDEVWALESTKPWYQDEALLSRSGVQEAQAALEARFAWLEETYPDAFQSGEDGSDTLEAGAIHLVHNPIYTTVKEPHVLYTLTTLLSAAEEEVYIQSPYVVCNDTMYNSLAQIAQSVPSVTMLVNSVASGDNIMASSDYLRNKGEVLETGISLYEYSGSLSSHSKCAVIDGTLAIVGSFNWDMRAAYLDTELMLVVASPELNQQLKEYERNGLSESRLCLDEDTYETPEGLIPPEMSTGKEIILTILQVVTMPVRALL